MRIFVTGATGFIGSNLCRFLLSKGHKVGVLIRNKSNLSRINDILNKLKIIEGSLQTIDASKGDIKAFSPDIIFHLAWHGVDMKSRNDISQLSINLLNSYKLFIIAGEIGIKKFIGLGSQAEYGHYDKIIEEDFPTNPYTLYGKTKLCSFLSGQLISDHLDYDFAWLRLFSAYGPMDNTHYFIPSLILSLLDKKRFSMTEGKQKWDYLYVEDAVNAMYKVAIKPEAKGVFNLASGEVHTLYEIAESIRDMIDPKVPIDFGKIPYRTDKNMHLQANINKLQKVIGWSPSIKLSEGLKRTIEYYKSIIGRRL